MNMKKTILALLMTTAAMIWLTGCNSFPDKVSEWQSLSSRVAEQIPELKISDEAGFSATGSLYVNPMNGDIYIVGNGIDRFVRSRDRGETWKRVKDVPLSGRTYGGFSINFDPQTGGMLAFTVKIKNVSDPQMAMSTDGGKNWTLFKKPELEKHDGFSWGMANWADDEVNVILAKRHHGAPQQWLSTDAGQTWKQLDFLCRNPGVINATTFVAGIDDSVSDVENGIYLSTDQGESYEKVSDYTVTGKFPVRWDDRFYWVVDDGLIVTRDGGRTWQHTGGKLDGGLWGPYFGRSEDEIMIVGKGGFYVTRDRGKSWQHILDFTVPGDKTDLMKSYNIMHPTASFGWDPAHDTLYAARYWWTAERYIFPKGTLSGK